jgi:hypothetical protein
LIRPTDTDVNKKIIAGKITMPDRTQKAVSEQLEAMRAELFEVGVFDAANEQMILRTWAKEIAFKSIAWLRFENLKGRSIYIRPAGIHSLSLVDDLKAKDIKTMKAEGFAPALVVETSPDNFQAWLQHSRTLDQALSTAVAKTLAKRFHADQGSADWRHFGRLAGFTNRKEKYRQADGHLPYVRLIETTGAPYPKAADFLAEVENELKAQMRQAETARKLFHLVPRRVGTEIKQIEDFRNDPRYGGAQSRSDMAYAVYALDHGVSEGSIRAAIASQGLSFKGSLARQADYLKRVIEKAQRFLQGSPLQR